ncbi:MAG: hypothetical protein AMJ46_10450 [Latescibacteria bacterium DG_63]|nr:MAG: hypothetical protein AMJ46_10450 [Latescibacteria bacterium DG_63]
MIPEKGKLQEFARDLLTLRGATVKKTGKQLLEVELGSELKKRLGRGSVLLAFSEETAARIREAELVTPGSYFFSLLLSLAREMGPVCRRVAKERTGGAGAFVKLMNFDNFGVEIVERERYYHLFVRFHFLVSYCTVDSNHEIRNVLYDITLRQVSSESEETWENVRFHESVPKWQSLASVGQDELVWALNEAASYVVARVRHKVFALKARSSTLLESELKRLEDYYRNLIQEEGPYGIEGVKRHPQNKEQAESCKVEWQRKAATEALRFWPRVRFSLIGLEEITVPRTILTLRVDKPPFTEFCGLFDHASGRAKGAFCWGCNGLTTHVWLDRSGAVLCEDCFSQTDK